MNLLEGKQEVETLSGGNFEGVDERGNPRGELTQAEKGLWGVFGFRKKGNKKIWLLGGKGGPKLLVGGKGGLTRLKTGKRKRK